MYEIDERDQVDELGNVPQSSVGAPLPVVLSVEGKVVLSFYLQNEPEDEDGESSRVITEEWEETIAIIEFDKCYAHMFGPPNDESFSGHPLATHGLRPYEAYEVLNSSWLRRLERMNSVHPYHNSENIGKGIITSSHFTIQHSNVLRTDLK